jgi:uncharacterized protein (TIGR02246 family)
MPTLTIESDIRRIIAELGRSIEARDFDAAAACFATDAVLMLPGQPIIIGSAAIRAALAGMFTQETPAVEVTVRCVEASASGDLAYAYGNGVTHAPMPRRSKWIAVLRRQHGAGEWRIVADIFNEEA